MSARNLLRRSISCLIVCVGILIGFEVTAQVPIPIQEQIERFNSLPPAQQQALIRELQRNLPPAQRQAIVEMLMRESGISAGGGAAQTQAARPDEARRGEQLPADFEDIDLTRIAPETFEAEDWLVIEVEERENARTGLSSADIQKLEDLQRRLREGNPYQLDPTGQLLLPGVPAIALGGLNAEQANARIRAEPALRQLEVVVTRLPLRPVGTAALQPFGYDFFKRTRQSVGADDLPVPVDYVIGPRDSINVQLFGNRNDEFFLTVTRDGVINFPEIGPINVAGLTFDAVRETINRIVSEQMIGVTASVTLGELRSVQVHVLGDVERPGSYLVSSFSTITNALYASGGVKEIGSLRNIAHIRDGQQIGTLDLYDLLLRGDTTNDARVQSGDAILVPPIGPTVAVDGEVRRPAIYEIRNEQTVSELVALAGGFKPNANRTTVKLERIVPNRGMTVEDVDLTTPAGQNVTVRDGDTVRVLQNIELLENAVRLTGNVYNSGLYQWFPGMRLSDLLPSPERVKPMSDLNYVMIRREVEPNVRVEVLSADLMGIWQGSPLAEDPVLQPRDTVYVFNIESGRQQIVEPIIEELQALAGSNQPSPVVRVFGRVRAPGEYPLESGMRISDLVRAGGGLQESAYVLQAELTRYEIRNGEYRETQLITVDLAAALRGDEQANLLVTPYDYLNIMELPRWREEASVTLRGEVKFPGTYAIRANETLSSVIERAGGLTSRAFPEGSVFTRQELREREREQLQTLARRLEADLASLSLSDPASGDAISIGQSLLNQLRNTQPTGRWAIRLDEILAGVPGSDILLQDGDELFVPQYSQEVTVLGEVQYPTSHVFRRGMSRDDYIARSGGVTRRADEKRTYIVRANGEVVASHGSRTWFRRRADTEIRPGDTIVVPIDVDRTRPLARWSSITQVMYNLAIAAAAVNSF